jgi:hypothetical protein
VEGAGGAGQPMRTCYDPPANMKLPGCMPRRGRGGGSWRREDLSAVRG